MYIPTFWCNEGQITQYIFLRSKAIHIADHWNADFSAQIKTAITEGKKKAYFSMKGKWLNRTYTRKFWNQYTLNDFNLFMEICLLLESIDCTEVPKAKGS